jgi:hypothetical protein
MKENIKPPPQTATTDNNDPNPFKIFGAKLRSRPIQGIVPSYEEQTPTSYSQQAGPSTYSPYHQSASQQQPSSSSFPSTQPKYSTARQ